MSRWHLYLQHCDAVISPASLGFQFCTVNHQTSSNIKVSPLYTFTETLLNHPGCLIIDVLTLKRHIFHAHVYSI